MKTPPFKRLFVSLMLKQGHSDKAKTLAKASSISLNKWLTAVVSDAIERGDIYECTVTRKES